MLVKFFDLKRQYELIKDEVEEEIIKVLRSTSYIGGEAVKNFEANIKKYLGVKYVTTVNSGTDALVLALISGGVTKGDEVITPSFSFFATSEAIARVGATPVFVDVKYDTYNIDVSKIEEKITSKTKAILPVHLFGKSADLKEISKLAKKHNLLVISDACQAIGAEYDGKKIGSCFYSDLTCFSFYPTKNLGAFGDGGMITTNNEKLYLICEALKTHGAGELGAQAKSLLTGKEEKIECEFEKSDLYDPYKYYNYLIAFNSRLDSIQAAVLSVKLKYLEKFNERRKEIALKYISGLKNTDKIKLPVYSKDDSWHQFVIRVEDKFDMCSYLSKCGVGNGNFYPVPLHKQKAFDYLEDKSDLKTSEILSKETVCLPIYPELTDEEIDFVIENVKKYVGEKND